MKVVIDKLPGGFVPDQVDYNLPEGVFSDVRNVRFRDSSAEKCKGNSAVMGSLSVTAIWAKPIQDSMATTNYWVYANEAIVYSTDGTTHTQISTASYNCPVDIGYTGGAFHGYMILNDTVFVPQRWDANIANKVRDLDNWPASTFCKVIRSFGDFLIALRVTQGGAYNPRLLRWSDIAAFGALPPSWDYTDPTNSAGITELGETPGDIVDCLKLRDANIVYKTDSTYLMSPIGGVDVFSFRQLFSQAGMLTENCAASSGTYHLVLTDSDVILHDGNTAQSIADKRTRRWLFNAINTSRYKRCFVVYNYREREFRICFPESGNDFPNLALCYMESGEFYVRELGSGIAHGEDGIVNSSETTFANVVGTFSSITGDFGDQSISPFQRHLVSWVGGAKRAFQEETGETFNGTTMSAWVERSNMGLTRDLAKIKRVKRIYPKITGTAGDTLQVYVGARSSPDSAVTYSGPFNFTIGTDYKIDCRVSGRWISLKFVTALTHTWRLFGFDVEGDEDGMR